MDDNDKSNPWDALIEDLGAQPDESAFERHQPPPQEIPPTVEWSEADEVAEQSKAMPSDWNSLAESLGLEVEQLPEPEPAIQGSVAHKTEAEPEATEEAIVPELEEPICDLTAAEEDSYEAASTDEFGGDLGEVESIDDESCDDELPPLPSQMDQALSDTAWQDSAEEEAAKADATSEGDDDSQGISGEAARSAFDALFSDGASSWGSAFLPTPKQDISPRAPAGSIADDDLSARLPDSLDATVDDGDETTDRPKRKRSRRRRRGGKGRKPVGEPTAEGEASADQLDEFSEETLAEGDTKPKRRRSRRRSRPAESGSETNDDELLLESEGKAGEERPRGTAQGRQRHRNLPTWSEAIGMIVDSNLEQRSKSPSKPQSSRGGRGGRGGRRRKKSENK